MPEPTHHSPLHDHRPPTASGQPRRLVLCFDGTGNQYMGTEEDTNIVKIYEALERHKPGQYAYYQRELTPYRIELRRLTLLENSWNWNFDLRYWLIEIFRRREPLEQIQSANERPLRPGYRRVFLKASCRGLQVYHAILFHRRPHLYLRFLTGRIHGTISR